MRRPSWRSAVSGVGEAPAAVKAVAGVALVALLVGAVVVVLLAYGGTFSSAVPVAANLSGQGNAVQPGDVVRYRELDVGEVASSITVLGPGHARVDLHLNPSAAREVPANVLAQVQPASIFGTQAVVLLDPAHPSPQHLRAHDVIAAAASSGGTSLQTTTADLDEVLDAVHPARLAIALEAVANALYGNGTQLGNALADTSAYLHALQPALPALVADLPLVTTIARQAWVYVPSLLLGVRNLTTTADTVAAAAAELGTLLGEGDTTANLTTAFLQQNTATYARLVADVLPLLDTVAAHPGVLPKTLQGLQAWTSAWTSAITPNHTMRATIFLPVPDPYSFVGAGTLPQQNAQRLAADQAFHTYLDPDTYTAADCPRYGALAGPNCGGASRQAMTSHAMTRGQQSALATVGERLDGRYDDSAVTALLLGPVLAGAAS